MVRNHGSRASRKVTACSVNFFSRRLSSPLNYQRTSKRRTATKQSHQMYQKRVRIKGWLAEATKLTRNTKERRAQLFLNSIAQESSTGRYAPSVQCITKSMSKLSSKTETRRALMILWQSKKARPLVSRIRGTFRRKETLKRRWSLTTTFRESALEPATRWGSESWTMDKGWIASGPGFPTRARLVASNALCIWPIMGTSTRRNSQRISRYSGRKVQPTHCKLTMLSGRTCSCMGW